MEIAIWLIVGLIAGGAVGAMATWWISRARGGVVSVMQLRQENDKFRDEVAEHFVETARLINQMSESYKQVFDHLSSGAEKLVDDEKLAARLPPATGQEVRLSQFGASTSAATVGEKSESVTKAGNPGSDVDGGSEADRPSDGPGSTKTEAVASKDPLKSGPLRSGDKASGSSSADSAGDIERGKDSGTDDGESDDRRKVGDASASDPSTSNQSGQGSPTKD